MTIHWSASVSVLGGLLASASLYGATGLQDEWEALQKAEELMRLGKPYDAWELIFQHKEQVEDSESSWADRWLALLAEASVSTGNQRQLEVIYRYRPQVLKSNELAALAVADQLLMRENVEDYRRLRDLWRGRESDTSRIEWFVRDGDATLIADGSQAAIRWLRSRSFPGREDAGRLMRVAILEAMENPEDGWEAISEAYRRAPDDPQIGVARAQLLESMDKEALAFAALITLAERNENQVMAEDLIAEFLLRHGRYQAATERWVALAHKKDLPAPVWLRAWFWQRVVGPERVMPSAPMNSEISHYLNYLQAIPSGRFWDPEAFSALPMQRTILGTEQSSFWLSVLQHLKDKQWEIALRELNEDPFSMLSWASPLKQGLKNWLEWMLSNASTLPEEKGTKDAILAATVEAVVKGFDYQRVTQHEAGLPQAAERDSEVIHLLGSPFGGSLLFLSVGWNEIGVALLPKEYSVELPAWYLELVLAAVKRVQGDASVEEVIGQLRHQHEKDYFRAQELIAHGKEHDAELLLSQVADSGEGILASRAVLELADLFLAKGQIKASRHFLESHPALKESVLGQELAARIALASGDETEAIQIYSALGERSPEAVSYLAKQAFRNKEWSRALALTTHLVMEFPEQKVLQENLLKVAREVGSTEPVEAR